MDGLGRATPPTLRPDVTVLGKSAVRAVAWLLGAALVAGASLLVATKLRFDPTGWLRWGREVGLGQGAFDTSGYPSWKPLALALAVPVAVTGSAAPLVWLLTVRTAGLLALMHVGRFAARRAGWLGGVVAASVLTLAPGWWPVILGGGIEPVIVGLGCAALAFHERRRYGLALMMLAAMALGREEALLLMLGYGLILRRQAPKLLPAAAVAAVVVAAAWLIGDWLGSGDPLHGASLARDAVHETPLTRFSGAEVAVAIVLLPTALALAVAGVRAARTAGDRVVLGIVAAGLVWIGIDALLLFLAYPVPARFVLPAAAAGAVVAGVGTRRRGLRT
jgi:hypothetical protein